MQQVEIITNNDNVIVIQLLDNPFTHDFVKQLEYALQYWFARTFRDKMGDSGVRWNENNKNKQQAKIHDAINRINDMGLNFPVAVKDVDITFDDYGRQMLNTLHRHFTTSHRSLSHGEEFCTWQDGTDLKFDPPADRDAFVQAVHDINDAVHELEATFPSARTNGWRVREDYFVQIQSWSPLNPDNDPQSYFLKDIKQEHFQYFSDELVYDVWLPLTEIQGKDYLRCYFDYDDPRHWDITTNIQYSGSMHIGDRSALRDPLLIEWMRSWGIEPGPLHCGMPLGNIISGKEHTPELEYQAKSVTLRD